ncbi:MAG: radical SAM protein, partial [Oscillospiraceae bacterium]|nr:radical SAM protein [Oscillospiraceae bacterium]
MLIGKTMSVCPVCLGKIPASKVLGEDGNIYMEKRCWEHGSFRTLIWEGDVESYRAWGANDADGRVLPVRAKPVEQGCPYDCGLCQNHERDGCCVLLELTKRCNLKCPVCFASAGVDDTDTDLSLEEIAKQYDMLMEHGGPFNIQLSGGEPTVRDDLDKIIALGREKGFSFFQLNTNGLRLADDPGYAQHLAKAGVSTVFLQFDGLDDDIYMPLRGAALTDTKLRAIENCKAAGLPIVL